MVLPLPRVMPAAAILALAAAPGPAARAMFQPGAVIDLGRDLGLDVRASAALDDGTLLVMEAARPCAPCLAAGGRDRCEHRTKPRLLHCRKMSGGAGAKEAWATRLVCTLPATTAGILGVRAPSVYLNELLEGVVRLPLARRQGVLRAARSQVVLGPGHLLELGIPFGCAPNLALAPDGSMVLAFDGSVALLPPGTGGAPWGSLRWLLGRAPNQPLPADVRPSLVPSVAADGTIHVVDRAKRAIFRFAPKDRKMSVAAKDDAWPDERKAPILAAGHGEDLLVNLFDGDTGRAVLGVVPSSRIPATRVAGVLDLPLAPNEAIRFTPQGDLLVTDVRQGGLRLVRARGPEPKAGRVEAMAGGTATKAAGAKTRAAKIETKAGASAGPALPPAARGEAAGLVRLSKSAGPALAGPRLVPVDKSDRLAIARATAAFAADKAFDRAFVQWARNLGGAGPAPDGPGLARNLGPFSLSHGSLKAVLRWLLANADEANHPADLAEWLAGGKAARPRFSFGLYRHARHAGVVLELNDLQEFAARIDEAGGGARVAEELAPAGGVSGYRLDRHGRPRYYQGLTVALGPDLQSLMTLHPGGSPGPGASGMGAGGE